MNTTGPVKAVDHFHGNYWFSDTKVVNTSNVLDADQNRQKRYRLFYREIEAEEHW